MAAEWQVESSRQELICPVCLDIFTDLDSLQCGHNFCRSCITQIWDKDGNNNCPECGAEFADGTLIGNWALSNLAEKTHKLNLNQREKESKLHCEKHQEELKLFCETDNILVCVNCRDAREHREHRFIPVEEAVENYKAHIKSSLESLTKTNSEIQEMEQLQKTNISGLVEQSRSVQSHITSVFTKKRQVLAEEEQRLLKDLREAEAKSLDIMEKNLQAIQEKLNSMQEKLTKMQERMDQKDSVIFLVGEIRRNRRISEEDYTSVEDGAPDVAEFDHPFLLKRVLSELSCGSPEVSITLDVETAHPELEVSEDRKRVRRTQTRRSVPDTGKWFTGSVCVLGSEGFTLGRHYWVVEVAGSLGWSLGVAVESAKRKGWVTSTPETGVWSIGWRCDGEFEAFTSPPSYLPARVVPGRVGVYLSYESGTVSFYDADTKSLLHTFTENKFTGKLYPFFGPWAPNEWLRICSGSAPGEGLGSCGAETQWTRFSVEWPQFNPPNSGSQKPSKRGNKSRGNVNVGRVK
ncbi:E3 ubiquitin-protein ligase TRIM21-like [Rhinoraja longicauda]